MKVFTTINPNGNFISQNEAMSSWASKFDVYSINTKEEIEKIKDLYTYINFIETENIFKKDKKKLVKLNAILNAIKKVNSKYSCIVNSDIILKTETNFNSILNDKHLNNGIVIGTRWELEDNKTPYPFNDGYDIFIIDIKNIDLFVNENYVIGMPWWDFWIPLISLKASMSVYHIKSKVIFHRTHKTNYDMDSWIEFGEHLYRDIIVNLMNRIVNDTVYNFCSGIKGHIESKQINIKVK